MRVDHLEFAVVEIAFALLVEELDGLAHGEFLGLELGLEEEEGDVVVGRDDLLAVCTGGRRGEEGRGDEMRGAGGEEMRGEERKWGGRGGGRGDERRCIRCWARGRLVCGVAIRRGYARVRDEGTDDKGRDKKGGVMKSFLTLVLRQRRLEELDLELLDVAAVVDEDVERGRLRGGGRAVGERVA